MSLIDDPRATRAPRTPQRPRDPAGRVGIELGPSRTGKFDGLQLPRTMSRRHLVELVELEPTLLAYLAGHPEAQWTFDDLPLVHGQPPAGSGMSTLSVTGGTVRVTNEFGSDVDGTVRGVHATDPFGTALSESTDVHIVGSLALPADLVPGPKPDPPMPAGF